MKNKGCTHEERGVVHEMDKGCICGEHEQYSSNKTQINNTQSSIPVSTNTAEPPTAFAQFWNLYPLKEIAGEKDLTGQAWRNLNPSYELATEIIGALEQQIGIWKDSGEFARDNGRWIPKMNRT
ncbi:MAG: hypothetical protein FWH20_07070 [Oscillospiraceae bacterium]|nr:hypothetical protein [Oscillospiraceae bacterium]